MLPDSCLYVLSMCLQLPVAISVCTEDTRSLIFNFAGKEGLCCCIDFAAVFYLLPIRDT